MSRNVVVTGMGAVTPLGASVAEFWDGLTAGRCAIEKRDYSADRFSLNVPVAPVDGLEARIKNLGVQLMRADRFSQLAALAAEEAVAQSGLEFDDALSARTACIIGTGIGGQSTFDEGYVSMLCRERRPHPLTILKLIPNAAASHLTIKYGVKGPSFAVSSACATGAHALGVTAELIKSGAADAGIAGASEAILCYGALEAWRAMHILADETCRPFSKNRNGLVIGEGAGVFILEEEEHAKKRGAEIICRLSGFGMNADGKDMINPDVNGAAGAMKMALKDIDIADPKSVYVNAHGTGTLLNDPTETKAIRDVFGAGADDLAVSSTKSMHGHLLGAAGGVESIAAILALKNGVVPPTVNYDEPDPECDLDYVPNKAKERDIAVALSNSFAFGGLNAVIAFEKL
ncbi:beta-ketoacyl-[acyl-carrier-protein] synthase family protein [Hyphococcus luteus]|uniref:Nodulation protein E n=1 Tax=Hyphococcus luteus TaxID=2058213 RepID=A0A2S7K9D6_9PROT|nr:beta-ketoacyl-[acyl-carrier-protein] synthase family protein [Marinicaulis flavus]PQA89098.1 beta-ACP synthase [Marinicaulis flavus]